MNSIAHLGEETIPADEPAHIARLGEILRMIQEERDHRKTPVPRNVHSKLHGGVRAELRVEPHLPPALRHGLFAEARTYPALVRFSNSKQPDDRLPDAHGMAIKLFNVPGEKLLPGAQHETTHDFLLIDHPVFFIRNVADFIPLAHDFRRLMCGGFFGKARTIVKAALSWDYRFRLMRKTLAKLPDNPLHVHYWSTTPLRWGNAAMKVSLRPRLDASPDSAPKPTLRAGDKLRLAMAAQLAMHEAQFDFLVQVQTDARTMPIEDPTVAWDESQAPFQKVATLRIYRQHFDSPAQRAFVEGLSFTPWHARADHRPLGGINRARRAIYEAMSARRRELNGAVCREPSVDEFNALWPLA